MLTRWWKYSEFKVWVWRKGQPCRCCVRDQTWSLRNCSTRDWVTHNYSCERNKTVQTDIDKDESGCSPYHPSLLWYLLCWDGIPISSSSLHLGMLGPWQGGGPVNLRCYAGELRNNKMKSMLSLSLQFRNSNISHSSSLTPWQLLVNLKYFYTTFIVIRQLLEFVKITDIVSRIPRNWGTEGEWERDQMSRFIAVCLP